MLIGVTFTVSRASAGRPRCRWRSGSDEGGALRQSRLSRAPAKVEKFKASKLNIDSRLSSVHTTHSRGSTRKYREEKESGILTGPDHVMELI